MSVQEKRKEERGILSSVEGHPRFPELRVFLKIAPGENGPLQKALRDLARCEAAIREAGSGPDLARVLERSSFAADEARGAVRRYRDARLPVPGDLLERCDKAEDVEAEAVGALAARQARLKTLSEELTAAHGRAVEALHAAFRSRFKALATEADCLVVASPEAARRHPERLDDRLLDLERQVRLGSALGLAFSSGPGTPGEGDFWGSLDADVADLVEQKWLLGRAQSAVVGVR